MNEITISELTEAEVPEILTRTRLDIVFLAQPQDKPVIQAAHGDPDSFVIIRMDGKFTGLRMTGGSRTQRQQRYWGMLASFQREGIGDARTPDGRQVKIVEGDDFLSRRAFLRKPEPPTTP